MSEGRELPRPAPAFRLGVVGNRDLTNVDRAALTATVTRFLTELRSAIDASLAQLSKAGSPDPYVSETPKLFLVNSLAEGADQLVADAALAGGHGYRLRCPIPFSTEEYKRLFTFDREMSINFFDRITRDRDHDPVVVELTCSEGEDVRSDGYTAAADILLDNSDLLFAVYDFSRQGSEGGTAETVNKGVTAGLPVVGIDVRNPTELLVLGHRGGDLGDALTSDCLHRISAEVLLPPDASAGLQRYLRESLVTGAPVTRVALRLLGGIYGAFWSAIPRLGGIASTLRSDGHHAEPSADDLPSSSDSEHDRVIDEVQRPYRERMNPVDLLAGFYMNLYRGSFVMNFMLGAFAVLFGLLSYFNHTNMSFWLRAEIFALSTILINFVFSRFWDWHGRALDYRFISEYLRQMTVLAPLGRSAPLIRPAPQYHGHDPTETWMGWYVRALDRDQGLIEFETDADPPAVLRMDEAFVATMRSRLCREWMLGQLQYYRSIERRFEGAIFVFRALMFLLFAVTAASVSAHLMHATIALDASAWREDALLTIIVAALPAFLGALHGIVVQGELEVIAERAGDMRAHLASALAQMIQDVGTDSADGLELSDQAVSIARIMLGEVLDWRIIHQAHAVELT